MSARAKLFLSWDHNIPALGPECSGARDTIFLLWGHSNPVQSYVVPVQGPQYPDPVRSSISASFFTIPLLVAPKFLLWFTCWGLLSFHWSKMSCFALASGFRRCLWCPIPCPLPPQMRFASWPHLYRQYQSGFIMDWKCSSFIPSSFGQL